MVIVQNLVVVYSIDFVEKLYIYYLLKEEWNQSKEGKKIAVVLVWQVGQG